MGVGGSYHFAAPNDVKCYVIKVKCLNFMARIETLAPPTQPPSANAGRSVTSNSINARANYVQRKENRAHLRSRRRAKMNKDGVALNEELPGECHHFFFS